MPKPRKSSGPKKPFLKKMGDAFNFKKKRLRSGYNDISQQWKFPSEAKRKEYVNLRVDGVPHEEALRRTDGK